MGKNSDYKRNLELASYDLDDFFLGCNVYSIEPQDVISTVVESLSSFLNVSSKDVDIVYDENFITIRFSKGGVKHG